MNVSSGTLAANAGRNFESRVEEYLTQCGFQQLDSRCKDSILDWSKNSVLKTKKVYARQPSLQLDDRTQRPDFIISGHPKFPNGLRIECKSQDVGGTADEKLACAVLDCMMGKLKSFLVVNGSGFRRHRIEDAAKLGSIYQVDVIDFEQFKEQFTAGLV